MINQYKTLSRVLPFAVYILFLALSDYLAPICHSLNLDDKWLYVFRIVVVALLIVYFWREFTELKHNALNVRPTMADLFVAIAAGLLVLFFWVAPFPAWATLGSDHASFNPVACETKQATFFWLFTRILGAALIVPVMEELFWRSFVMRWVDSKNFLSIRPESVSLYAYIASSALFALEHNLWLAGLFAGLVYGALYIKYKNLWVPIFAHAVTNGLLGIWVVQTGNWQYW